MLGRLLSSANSATSSPAGSRPSTSIGLEGEDWYTRTLLYPDTSLLSHNHSLSGCSYASGGPISAGGESIDIDGCRDFRVVIVQDGTGSDGKVIIYDSKPGSDVSTTYNSSQVYNSSFEDGAPPSPGLCGGLNRRRRSPNPFNSGPVGLGPRDEWRVMTDCMFGAVSLAYKGPSTKLHILPSLVHEEKLGASTIPDPRSRGRGPHGIPHLQPSPFAHHNKDRKSVLITRLFSVVVPISSSSWSFVAPDPPGKTPIPTTSVGSTKGYPFPKVPAHGTTSSKPIKPTKTSMYGIGLIISLPQSIATSSRSSSTIKRCPNCWTIQYDFDSRQPSTGYYCCDVTAASMDDEYRIDSVTVEAGPESGIADDQMEHITKHWDIITRALTELQATVRRKIVQNLITTGIISPFPQAGYKFRNRVELRPGALMCDETLRLEIERFKWRIVGGMKIPRVVTGQGRWGVWRDEARWLNKRFGGKEQNFLFLTLMTAFLGHHTDWLDVLGPLEYRKHQQRRHSAGANDDSSLATRTVIISQDKITARRIIYLLSAFLPAKNLPAWPGTEHTLLNSRNSSSNMLSQSPPVLSFLSRASTRRKPRKRPSKLSVMQCEGGEEGGWDIPIANGAAEATLLRQQSDSSLQLPTLSLGSTRKSGTLSHIATATTAAHHKDSRPGSSGSCASFSLMHTLRRSGTGHASTESSATGTSGWSFLSSFWSNPRLSTGCASEASTYPDDPIDCSESTRLHHSTCTEKDDDEVVVHDHDLYPGYDDQVQSPPKFDSIPFTRPSQQDAFLNVSVAEDGVVDVDIPLGSITFPNPPAPGHSTANSASPIGSPASMGYNFSLLSLDRNSLSSSSFPHDNGDSIDITTNVAGWMEEGRFHPDFSLQAVQPYVDLEADIKRSMRAEPTPRTPPNAPAGKWIEVCSVLLADTRTCTIKRLKLRRRRTSPLVMMAGDTTVDTPNTLSTATPIPEPQRTPSSDVTGGEDVEEEIAEERVMDMDDILATAVERTIGVDTEYDPSRTANKPKRSVLINEFVPPSTPNSKTNKPPGMCLGSDCKGLIIGALEEVAQRCATRQRAVGARRANGFVENVLTEGVVRWLSDIEEFCHSS